jgi:hypothetical protein
MAQPITMYRAFDGSVFETEEECMEHDGKNESLREIYAFIDSPANRYKLAAQRSMAINTLLAFLRWTIERKDIDGTDTD